LTDKSPGSGTSNEKALHAALKAWYKQPEDRCEVRLDGFIIDIVRGRLPQELSAPDSGHLLRESSPDHPLLLIEIQTRNFSAIKKKLLTLVEKYPVRLVHPVAQEKWIIKLAEDGQTLSRRRSPKRGRVEEVFAELLRIPTLLEHPNFSLEVALIEEEETRQFVEGKAWRRKGWVTVGRSLVKILEQHTFTTPTDLARVLPGDLPAEFTVSDLVKRGPRRWLAQKMVYCLKTAGVIQEAGKKGRSRLYRRVL
jgi:hypothetical protein